MKFKRLNKTQKIIFAVVVLLLLVGVYRIAGALIGPAEEKEAPVNVTVAQVEKGSIYTTSPITGRIAPVNEAVIIPLASGKVTAVNVALGDYVEKGAVLFEIDKTQIAASYSQATAAYQAAETAYNAMSTLYAEGAVSKSDYESARTAYTAAQAAATQAAEAYKNCSPAAPISGYVTSLNVSVGNLAPSGSVAATVADTSSLKIDATVSEYLIGKIAVGDKVDIYVSSLSDKAYSGEITAVSPAPAAGSLTYPVTITVTDTTGDIKAGMFAEVRVVSESKEQVIIVPSDAVIIKGGKSLVVILDQNDIPSFKEVTTGTDNGEYIEITKGLKTGDTIVKSGQQYITEGEKVNVVK